MNIINFKKGDIITRTHPAKPYSEERMGIFGPEGGIRDRSYMGDNLLFVGIANGQIYFKNQEYFHVSMFGDKVQGVALDIWDEGWEYYVDPKSLTGDSEVKMDKSYILVKIKEAEEAEDYELALKLKHQLEQIYGKD
jgi:hypothetical protein